MVTAVQKSYYLVMLGEGVSKIIKICDTIYGRPLSELYLFVLVYLFGTNFELLRIFVVHCKLFVEFKVILTLKL